MENRKRLDWVDCAKGIAGILVIIGHAAVNGFWGSVIRSIIFSFHMPLFFTLSCITYKFSSTEQEFIRKVKKSFRHLICPALALYLFEILKDFRNDILLIFSFSYWRQKLLTLAFASGVSLDFYGLPVGCLGMMWFLFALFISRSLLDYLHLKMDKDHLKLSICFACCTGVLFGSVQWLPFSMDIALAVLPFLYYGAYIKENSYELPLSGAPIIWCGILGSTLLIEYPEWTSWTYLELACRRYPMFPICYLTAIAGISATVILVKWFTMHCEKLVRPFIFIGKHSMIFYLVHAMDYLWEECWNNPSIQIPIIIMRLLVDVLAFVMVVLIVGGIQKLQIKKFKSR